jgi:hypothetical protein
MFLRNTDQLSTYLWLYLKEIYVKSNLHILDSTFINVSKSLDKIVKKYSYVSCLTSIVECG